MEFEIVEYRIEIDEKHLDETARILKGMDPVVLKAMTDRLMGKVLDEINTRCLVEAYRPLRYSKPIFFC